MSGVIHGAGGFCDTVLVVTGACLLVKALSTLEYCVHKTDRCPFGSLIRSGLRISALKASLLFLCMGL